MGYAFNSSDNDPVRGVTTIERMRLTDLSRSNVVTFQGDVLDVTWSPDGGSVAYIVYTPDSNNQLWLKVGSAAPEALTPLIPLFGRDGSISDQTVVSFSPDGRYLLMVDTFVAGVAPPTADQAIVQVRSVPDGRLVFVPPSALKDSGGKGGPFITMAAWSHLTDRLYYRDLDGVQTWDAPSTVGDLAPAVQWLEPSISPNDRVVAYMVYASGVPHVEIRDLASGSVRVLPGTLGYPTMLSDTSVFEWHMSPNNQMGPPYLETAPYLLDLQTNSETATPDWRTPLDVWPH
jgi:Tol biopolymer transport system component